ncbi:hypothetical protein D3C76_876390 [compost metagenome]
MNAEYFKYLDFNRGGIGVYTYDIEGELLQRKLVQSEEEILNIMDTPEEHRLVLECSTKGDKRFSAYGAYIKLFGMRDNIEFIYQLSKRVQGVESVPVNAPWAVKLKYVKQIKGKQISSLCICGKHISPNHISSWYNFLWLIYLDAHPQLVQYLELFDDYNDVFKGSSICCQADAIRKYVKQGPHSIISEMQPFLHELKSSH